MAAVIDLYDKYGNTHRMRVPVKGLKKIPVITTWNRHRNFHHKPHYVIKCPDNIELKWMRRTLEFYCNDPVDLHSKKPTDLVEFYTWLKLKCRVLEHIYAPIRFKHVLYRLRLPRY